MNLLRSKKGFTLVEIIVVLVIIAILAAISLPALTGYITDAKEKSAISEAHTAYVAGQTIASELSGKDVATANIISYLKNGTKGTSDTVVPAAFDKTIYSLTGLKSPAPEWFNNVLVADDGTITRFVYGVANAWVVYDGTAMSFNTSATAPSLPA